GPPQAPGRLTPSRPAPEITPNPPERWTATRFPPPTSPHHPRGAAPFDDDPHDIDPTYAPLLDADVPCVLLDVYQAEGDQWSPAYDHDDRLVEALVTDTQRELSERITRPGRYRVVARDPRTKRILRRKDWTLRPSPRPGAPRREANAAPALVALYQEQLRTALEAKAQAEQHLFAERQRCDDRVREQRHDRDALERALREQIDAAKARSHDAEVKCAAMASRLESRDERVAQLEEQLAEMKAEVGKAQALAAELKQKAEEAEFSPLDAIMQMDQALDVLGKTAERFGG
ncbi:MAG: hypothetical protein KC766_07985, partial [Myxococcales bacterium]|nr:hypothetical protein [Myxococcales bacterium]